MRFELTDRMLARVFLLDALAITAGTMTVAQRPDGEHWNSLFSEGERGLQPIIVLPASGDAHAWGRCSHPGAESCAGGSDCPARTLGSALLGRCMMVIGKAFQAPVRGLLPRRACGCVRLYDGR